MSAGLRLNKDEELVEGDNWYYTTLVGDDHRFTIAYGDRGEVDHDMKFPAIMYSGLWQEHYALRLV